MYVFSYKKFCEDPYVIENFAEPDEGQHEMAKSLDGQLVMLLDPLGGITQSGVPVSVDWCEEKVEA
jgi:hypothetical protein